MLFSRRNRRYESHISLSSAEHPSDNGKNYVAKKTSWHDNILNTIAKNLSKRYQTDSARED